MRRAVAAVALAAAALAPACGHKSRPIAPELVQPSAPGDVTAIATPEGVRVSWTRPAAYTSGRRMDDLGTFVVERAAADVPAPAFEPVHEIVLDDRDRFRKERRFSWTDPDVTPGTRYLYRVVARTIDDYESRPGGPVAVRFGAPSERPDEPAPPAEKETPR